MSTSMAAEAVADEPELTQHAGGKSRSALHRARPPLRRRAGAGRRNAGAGPAGTTRLAGVWACVALVMLACPVPGRGDGQSRTSLALQAEGMTAGATERRAIFDSLFGPIDAAWIDRFHWAVMKRSDVDCCLCLSAFYNRSIVPVCHHWTVPGWWCRVLAKSVISQLCCCKRREQLSSR